MQKELIIKKAIRLNADTTRVWDALTNPELTPKVLFGCVVESEWEEGSEIVWKNVTNNNEVIILQGTILQIEPYKLLEATIHDPNNVFHDDTQHQIILKQELEEQNGQTILTITQGDYALVEEGEKRYNDAATTWEQAFVALQELCDISYEESN